MKNFFACSMAMAVFAAPILLFGQGSNKSNNGVNVYPNPAHNYFNVSLKPGQYQALALVNVAGQTVVRQSIAESATTLFIPTLKVDTGRYTLNLFDGKSVTAERVIIGR